MSSPQALVEEVAKAFKVSGEKRVHPRQQRAYVESQVQEQALIVNRLLVDCAKAKYDMAAAKDENTKAAYQNKLAQYEGDLRQLSTTLDFFIELQGELAKAYPEGDSGKADRPDGF
jgi:hypothetical protein